MIRKMLILPLLLGLVAVNLAGCGRYDWQKPGASDADFAHDRDACMAAGDQGFTDCMGGRGWRLDT